MKNNQQQNEAIPTYHIHFVREITRVLEMFNEEHEEEKNRHKKTQILGSSKIIVFQFEEQRLIITRLSFRRKDLNFCNKLIIGPILRVQNKWNIKRFLV